MKQMRTALVRTDIDKHCVIRRDDYDNQKDFAADLRGNGYKVLKIWNGNISDDETSEWHFLNRNPREAKETKNTNTIDKPYTACFCTYDGTDDDVTASFDTESEEFATAQEAYEACRTFIKTCDGYLFAGCYIEHWSDSGCKTIFNCTCENFETFYIDDKEVEFDAFNAKYHVYTPKFTAELDGLFMELENAVYSTQQAKYFKGEEDEAVIEADYRWDSIIEKIWYESGNYDGHHDDITAELSKRTNNGFDRFNEWKSNYEMIQNMKAEGKGVIEMVAALNGAEVPNKQANAQETKLIVYANTGEMNRHEQIREQFEPIGARVFDINQYIRKAAKFGRKTLLESYEKWHDYAERVNYLLPIIEVKNKNGNLLYYRDSIFNGLESIPKPVVAKLVVEGLAFIKRAAGSILVNLSTERNAPAEWIQKEATADKRAAEEDAKDKADYENRIEVINRNIEKTFAKNDFTPEQVQAFKAIYDYEFAATIKKHTDSKATNYDELKVQHDAAYKKLRADSHAAREANNLNLFMDIHGMITDYATLGQLEAVYSIYWDNLKVVTPNEVDVEDYAITPEAQDIAVQGEIDSADIAEYLKAEEEASNWGVPQSVQVKEFYYAIAKNQENFEADVKAATDNFKVKVIMAPVSITIQCSHQEKTIYIVQIEGLETNVADFISKVVHPLSCFYEFHDEDIFGPARKKNVIKIAGDICYNYWNVTPDEPEEPKANETTTPLFYVENDKPFTVMIDGRIKKDFAGAKEAIEYLKEFNVKNPTAECQIEDADGDMIYEDDKIQIRYYDTEGNEVDYDTFLKIYLALGIKNDCGQSSIMTA